MTVKQRALKVLTKDELLALGKNFDLDVGARMSVDELVRRIAASKHTTLNKIIPMLGFDRLREMCNALDLPIDGRAKQVLVDRLLAALGQAPNEGAPPPEGAASYEHKEEAVARPDVGTQPEFKKKRPARIA